MQFYTALHTKGIQKKGASQAPLLTQQSSRGLLPQKRMLMWCENEPASKVHARCNLYMESSSSTLMRSLFISLSLLMASVNGT